MQRVSETEATFVWLTDQESTGWVEIAPDDSTHFYAIDRPKHYQTYLGKKYTGTIHTVCVDNLTPGTSYRYRVYSQATISHNNGFSTFYGKIVATNVFKKTPLQFKTLDTSKTDFAFVVINDIHENNELQTSLLNNIKQENVDFVVFNGDMVSDMRTADKITDGFLKTASNLFASELPLYMVRGNHEPRGMDSQKYMNFFPSATGQPYYTFQHGNTFFIVLDSGEDKPDNDIEYWGLGAFDEYRANEAKWLKKIVRSHEFLNAKHKIVIMHMPPILNHWYGPAMANKLFVPVLNEAKIDLMLCGHFHRHWFIEKNYQNCDFPILVNSNKNKTKVKISANAIVLTVADEQGKPIFEKKLGF
ncbi:MAG: metallophosphoesterase [Pigmentiphaga sp.]|nr:metallophosphoesterase [Pigmentiphaga sp.]